MLPPNHKAVTTQGWRPGKYIWCWVARGRGRSFCCHCWNSIDALGGLPGANPAHISETRRPDATVTCSDSQEPSAAVAYVRNRKKNKKLLLLSTVKSLTSPSVWQTNLLKYSIAPGSEWLKKWDVSKEDIYVLLWSTSYTCL